MCSWLRVAAGSAFSWQLQPQPCSDQTHLLQGGIWGFLPPLLSPHILQLCRSLGFCHHNVIWRAGFIHSHKRLWYKGIITVHWYSTATHSNVEYKDTEGGKHPVVDQTLFGCMSMESLKCAAHHSGVQSLSREQKAVPGMEIGISDKRSERAVWKGELLISWNEISWKLYQIKKVIENVSVFNRDYVQENKPAVNSATNTQVQAFTDGKRSFIHLNKRNQVAILQRGEEWKLVLDLSSSCKINVSLIPELRSARSTVSQCQRVSRGTEAVFHTRIKLHL